jgi:hypothetical protein
MNTKTGALLLLVGLAACGGSVANDAGKADAGKVGSLDALAQVDAPQTADARHLDAPQVADARIPDADAGSPHADASVGTCVASGSSWYCPGEKPVPQCPTTVALGGNCGGTWLGQSCISCSTAGIVQPWICVGSRWFHDGESSSQACSQ